MRIKLLKNILSIFGVFFFFIYPLNLRAGMSAGDYFLESSIIASGGGEKLTGGDYLSRGAIAQVALAENYGLSANDNYVKRGGFYNPPRFTYQRGLPLSFYMASGNIKVTIPANSIDKEMFDITINKNPLTQPMSVDPDKIEEANDRMVFNEGSWSQLYSNNLTEFAIFDEQDFYTKPLLNKGLLTMYYEDNNDDKVVDNTSPPVRTDTLSAWALDETLNMWIQMPGTIVDDNAKTLTTYFSISGVYALIGQLDTSVKNVHAFPVPFRPNGPNAGSNIGQTGAESDGITFVHLPQKGNVEIYTLDGRLVKKIDIASNLFDVSKINWDVKNTSGDKVASGVYIWRVVSGSNSKTGKLMIIW